MTRYRAVTLGHPKGPWRSTAELAKQDAIEAGDGSRSAFSGTVYLSVGTSIEEDAGEVETTREQRAWAFALDQLAEHGVRVFRVIEAEVLRPIDDLRRRRLKDARRRVKAVLDDARQTEEKRRSALDD